MTGLVGVLAMANLTGNNPIAIPKEKVLLGGLISVFICLVYIQIDILPR